MSTTVITRLYNDTQSAEAVQAALLEAGLKRQFIDIIDQSGASQGPALRERMLDAKVNSDAADIYARGVESGNALLVVRVPFMPFGAAARTIEIVDDFPSIDVGVDNQNAYISEDRRREYGLSVLPNSPRFLTGKVDANRTTVSEAFQIPTLAQERPWSNAEKRRKSVMHGGAFMSTRFFPLPLLTQERRRTRNSVIRGGAHIIPFRQLTPDRHPYSVLPGGGTPLSKLLGWPLLTERK